MTKRNNSNDDKLFQKWNHSQGHPNPDLTKWRRLLLRIDSPSFPADPSVALIIRPEHRIQDPAT